MTATPEEQVASWDPEANLKRLTGFMEESVKDPCADVFVFISGPGGIAFSCDRRLIHHQATKPHTVVDQDKMSEKDLAIAVAKTIRALWPEEFE